MKKLIRRILAYTLMMVMCVSTVDISVFARENITVEYDVVEETTSEVAEESITEDEETTTKAEEESTTEVEETTTVVIEESTAEVEETTTVVEEESATEVEETTTVIEEESATEVEETTTEVEETLTVEKEENTWDGITTQNIYETSDYRVIFSLDSYWEGGYNASIVIENTSDSIIENWYLKYDFANVISNIWNAEIYSYDAGEYVIKNADWNQDIAVGSQIQYGFSSNENFNGFPQTYELIGELGNVQEEGCSVEYYLDSDWGSGFSGRIVVTNNTAETIEDWVLEFDFARDINSIWNAVVESNENYHYTIKNAGYNANIPAGQTISFGFLGYNGVASDIPQNYLLYAYEPYNGDSMELDTDGDGIVDGNETSWGLDYKKVDSDGDGLTDYEEVYITLTDALKKDTDGNGIDDASDDMDGDKINNLTEISYGTNPLSADTDKDNVTDYEEIFTYGSNALVADTDGDGLTDYDDISLGFSPLLADTDNDGTLDPHEKLEQLVEEKFDSVDGQGVTGVSVSMNVAGNAQTQVRITNIYEVDIQSDNVIGLVGVPVEISSDLEFDSAEITFFYDETMLGNVKEEDLAILWYDEENNWYQILDEGCVVDTVNNKVSYVTTHFSTYMLVDSQSWYNAWRENIDYRNSEQGDEKHYFDIAFVVDVSGSMSGSYINTAKLALANFVDSMQTDDEAALVRFASSAYIVCDFTNDTAALKNSINSLYASGGTNVNKGLLKALDVYADRDSERQKIIVLICDGDVNYVQSTIDSCIEQNIQIYAVNVASASAHTSLQKMASQTGGQYYYGATSSSITDMLSVIKGETVDQIDATDTDGDGLYDIYETAGMKLPNGQIVYTDPSNADTDGDGLTDFEETGLIYNLDDRYIGFGMFKSIKCFRLKSDPTSADTDGDNIGDKDDPYPWKPESIWVAELSNKYAGTGYLNIQKEDGSYAVGGNQGWWEELANSTADYNYDDFSTDKNYRIWQMGCGVIAMSDIELYLMQQNEGYQTSLSLLYGMRDTEYNVNTGVIQKDEYMDYVEINADLTYLLWKDRLHYETGVLPMTMDRVLENYLSENGHEQTSVTWAPYTPAGAEDEKLYVLHEIRTMLDNDLPVVFAYFTFDKNNPLTLYTSLEYAKTRDKEQDENSQDPTSHYMTIIGLYKYFDETIGRYEYIMEVTSWGKRYYARYDEYSDNLTYFSNILRIQ